jgi:hypothetical protein
MEDSERAGGWMKVTLKPDDIIGGMSLHEAFNTALETARFPKGAAMFRAVRPVQNAYYFSPGAVAIARSLLQQFHAEECEMPVRSDVGLTAAGAGVSLDMIFGNS